MMKHADSQVTGLERLLMDDGLRVRTFGSRRIGLVTNFTAVTRDYRRAVDALITAGVHVVALFSPEHGLNGTAQAGHAEQSSMDTATGLPVYDIYTSDGDELDAMVDAAGIDMLACDLQDVGTRCWTYPSTMIRALRSASRLEIPFVVLDRPNPLGGQIAQGPTLDPRFTSFVGALPVPVRHGLTMGELARFATINDLSHGIATNWPQVVAGSWDRSGFSGEATLWLPPSPNLATIGTARAYPGMSLLEGTNCSEGRGTTHPFEMFGAPWVDDRLVAYMRSLQLEGVLIREVSFVPVFSKYSGQVCHGVFLHIADPVAFNPIHTGLAVLAGLRLLYPGEFSMLPPSSVGASPVLDLLWGSDRLRLMLEHGQDVLTLDSGKVFDPRELYPQGVFGII